MSATSATKDLGLHDYFAGSTSALIAGLGMRMKEDFVGIVGSIKMKYEDVPVGGEVILGGRLANSHATLMNLFGVTGKVIAKFPPVGPKSISDAYPCGMVSIQLPAGTNWNTQIIYMGPEDLAETWNDTNESP